MLIYFERELQDRAVALCRDSLCMRGFFGIGAKETLRFSSHVNDFDIFSAEERWYQRR